MKANDRALGFVSRANAALVEPESANERWSETIRSKTDERLVHSFPAAIDRAVRRVEGDFEHWHAFTPDGVEVVLEVEAMQVFCVLSAHPSGWVRQRVVERMAERKFDRVAPHLTNRALDFVPSIREAAQPVVHSALASIHAERAKLESTEKLPSAANIAIARLMRPRAATLCPELVQLAILLGVTAVVDQPGRLRERDDPMLALAPFKKALQGNVDSAQREALEAQIEYLTPD